MDKIVENTIQETGTARKKFHPVRIKDIMGYDNKPKNIDQTLSVRKRVEPMKVKDLIRSLSDRKKPESVRIFPTKSADRNTNVSRETCRPPETDGKPVRRKLYSTFSTQIAPKECSNQSRLVSNTKTQQLRARESINSSQTVRKSLLLPRNSIKEFYVRKRLSQGTILETSHEESPVQNSNEILANTTFEKPSELIQENNSSAANSATLSRYNIVDNGFDIISSQSPVQNESNNNVKGITNIPSTNNDPTVLLSTADTTEKGIQAENENVQSEFLRPSVIIEPRILHPLQGYSENSYGFYAQPFLTNQILLQVPQNAENIQNVQHMQNMLNWSNLQSVPIVNSTCDLQSEHVVVERNKLLSMEAYLKEGIVNMTQALNLVQATLYSNPLNAQVVQRVPPTSYPSAPVEQISQSPVLETANSDSIELRDIKIEPTYGDTSPPSDLFRTSLTPEVQNNNEDIAEDPIDMNEIKVLRVRLENCFLKTPKKNVSVNITEQTSKLQNTAPTNHDVFSSQKPTISYETNENLPQTPDINLLKTPKRNSIASARKSSKTPKTTEKNLFITPCRKMDNKENFQTPISRRKTFSGLDSQNLRRSVRIARHHLRQSLGDDSFLALEKELNIIYPPPNI